MRSLVLFSWVSFAHMDSSYWPAIEKSVLRLGVFAKLSRATPPRDTIWMFRENNVGPKLYSFLKDKQD